MGITTTDDFIRKSTAMFGVKFRYENADYVDQDTRLILNCPEHGEISITPRQHYRCRYGCHRCSDEIPRTSQEIAALKEAVAVHKSKYDYGLVMFKNMNEKVKIVCPKHGPFKQSLYDHTARQTGCPHCSRESDKLTLEDFVEKSKAIHGDSYDYSKVVYVTNVSKVIITCKKHGDFTQRAASHLAGCICRKCFFDKIRLSKEEFVKNAITVHGETYDYSKVTYIGNKIPVEVTCSLHGDFWVAPNAHVSNGTGCPRCNASKGERATEQCLIKLGLNYIREYRIKPYRFRYDFYLSDYGILIEFHGQQHYRPIEMFGGEANYAHQVERDALKKQIARKSKKRLVVINYLNLIDNSVEKELIRKLSKLLPDVKLNTH